MARIKGKSIVFEIDGVEYSGGVSNVTFSSAVGELGFGNYEENLDFTATVEGFQDTAAASLWSTLFDAPGVSMSITYAPHGNASPSAEQPHFTATGYAETVPDLGGTAGEFFTFDMNIILDAKPTKVTS